MERAPCGVLLLDLGLLDGPDGVSAGLRSVRARFPAWHVVALSEHETREGVLQCLAAGAHGAVAKTACAAELLRAVTVVGSGGVHVPAVLAEPTPPAPLPRAPLPRAPLPRALPVGQLTERQRDVLRLMAEGGRRRISRARSTCGFDHQGSSRGRLSDGRRAQPGEALCRAGLLPRDPLAS